MLITIVVAASENNVIGKKGDLPWHLPDDLLSFKEITLGKPIIMGRNTFESMGSKPLVQRTNIILSSQKQNYGKAILQFTSYEEAIAYLQEQNTNEVCVIGGSAVFAKALEQANQLYLTRVHCTIENGDAFLPNINFKLWEKKSAEHHIKDNRHNYEFTLEKYIRK